jgi:hypothetical protein
VSMRACWFSGPTPTSDRASSSTPTRTQDSRTRAVRPRSSARWVPRFRRASAAEAPAATPSPVIARRAAAAPQAALLTSARLLNAENFLTIYPWRRRRSAIPRCAPDGGGCSRSAPSDWRRDRPGRSRTRRAPCRRARRPARGPCGNVTIGGPGCHANRQAETGWPTPRSASSRRSASDPASGPPTAARVASLTSASLGLA